MSYDPQDLEARWRERWAESGRYEADPDGRDHDDATFVTVPYPYPNGGMHIGHARTYTVPDVYARYRRQQGDNVLFPIAWHVTGTPIVGAVERLKAGDEGQIDSLQNAFGVPEPDLADLETPMGFARYFIENHYKEGMSRLGLSVDWRREFTTNDERYTKFISWQYETLRERGLLEKGLHPVNYCTNEAQPVTTHDIYEGEDAEFQEYSLIKFDGDAPGGAGDATVFPMATLRPETVRGVTNAFVDPEAEYVRARVDGEAWIVSREATEKLELQAREVEIKAAFEGADLVGRRVQNPVTDEAIPLLPADFVDTDSATGVVMSVPAHSPDDWIALEEAKARADDLTAYGLDPEAVREIEPRRVITIEGYGEFPATDALEDHGVESSDDPAIEAATQELYNREFHAGELGDDYGGFAGEVIEDVRGDLDAHYRAQGTFDSMYDFAEEVICRCGGDVEVAEQDTWFLRYNDEDWREKAHRAVDRLDAIPANTKEQYDHTVDWLEEWPCIRNYGLGTRLPWDDEFVIEPLSDSTIYMAYYTIAHLIEDVPVDVLDRNFFDTLLLGPESEARRASGQSSSAERSSADSHAAKPRDDGDDEEPRDPDERALELREEFEYWYPVSVRCSANDLIANHLTFFLYHHAELFEAAKWPEGITVMGMGLLEGESMSSSRGHVVLPDEAIERYGADTVRFFLLNSAEPWQDFDWRADAVGSTRDQLESFWDRAESLIERGERSSAEDASGRSPQARNPGEHSLERIDRWLLASLQETVREVTEAMENFETRTASQVAFYRFAEHLRWYRRRTDRDRPWARWTLRTVLETRLRLLCPFVPFMANELHERLTGEPAEDVPWPEPVPAFEDDAILAAEELVRDLVADVRDIVDVTETDPETIRIYAAADWKRDVFDTVIEVGPDQGQVMSAVMENDALRDRGDAVNDLVGDLVGFVRERDDETLATLSGIDEHAIYADAAAFLEREFDAAVAVYAADGDHVDPAEKATQAQPFRPAIHLE